MNTDLFFDLYVKRLRRRASTIRSFITVASPETWFSMEAAAVVDRYRAELGIGGSLSRDEAFGVRGVPRWLVAPERGKVDLWIEDQSSQGSPSATAIEFKVVHNNKNLLNRLKDLQLDLLRRKVPTSTPRRTKVNFVGVVIVVYHRLQRGQEGGYQILGGWRRPAIASDFQAIVSCHTHSKHRAIEFVAKPLQLVCSLDGANYTERGRGAAVWVTMVERLGWSAQAIAV
jgi:hypothetical protein